MRKNEHISIAQELARTIARFKRLSWQHKSHQVLRQSEFLLLATLKESLKEDPAGIRVSDLSSRLQITRAGVTQMVNSLETRGYLERLSDAADRRVVRVKPTEKGDHVIKAMHLEFLETLQELVCYLGEEESKELIQLLSKTFHFIRERRINHAEKFET